LSRPSASPHFSLLNAALTHYHDLGHNWSVKLAAAGQFASGPLLTSQQFYLGGLSFGRGFQGGWIAGDDGLAGSAELRYDYNAGSAFMKGIQLYGFMEGGVARTRLQPGHFDQTLVSVGAGFRISVTDDLQLGLAIAKPIAENGLLRADRGVSVLFSLSNILRLCPDRQDKFCRS
ncbi:MAG: ShlB/FhaC/HecB family hemolysin secretion/activation protein, partial [Bosea sp. (in: a-proteobacteria)]